MRTLIIYIISSGLLFSSLPEIVLLTDNVSFPLEAQGKIIGSVKVPKGTSVKLLGWVDKDHVRLRHNNVETTASVKQTDLQDKIADQQVTLEKQKETEEWYAKRRAENEQSNLMHDQRVTQEQKASEQRTRLDLMKQRLGYFEETDREIGDLWNKCANEYIDAYEHGNDNEKEAVFTKYANEWNSLLESKPIYAMKYNEFIKRSVEVPMLLNVFEDSHDFYIQVGDGNLCTVAPMTRSELYRLESEGDHVNEWIQQCITQKLDVKKEIGQVGSLNLEFISQQNGNNIYIELTAKGSFEKDRLIKEQTVRMNILNWSCLVRQCNKADEISAKRRQLKENAEKLK